MTWQLFIPSILLFICFLRQLRRLLGASKPRTHVRFCFVALACEKKCVEMFSRCLHFPVHTTFLFLYLLLQSILLCLSLHKAIQLQIQEGAGLVLATVTESNTIATYDGLATRQARRPSCFLFVLTMA